MSQDRPTRRSRLVAASQAGWVMSLVAAVMRRDGSMSGSEVLGTVVLTALAASIAAILAPAKWHVFDGGSAVPLVVLPLGAVLAPVGAPIQPSADRWRARQSEHPHRSFAVGISWQPIRHAPVGISAAET